MSKDTIYREDAIDAIYEHEFSNWCDKDEVSTILYDLPSANRLQGEWIGDKCSVCGNERAWYGCNPPFCLDCGADMRDKDDE